MFNSINSIKPYFFSLREIQDKVSLDIKIPTSWMYNNITQKESNEVVIKQQDENEKSRLISLIGTATKEGYDSVFTIARSIIKYNQEIEEKNRLFNEKVEELKKVFLESPLDKLKEISFIKNNVRDKKSTRKTGTGTEKESGRDRKTQTEND